MSRNRTTRARPCKPRLEWLEDRCQPATVTFNAGLLEINADHAANVVAIDDDGTTVAVVCDGDSFGPFTGVTDIRVTTWNGNDRVYYNLAAVGAPVVERRVEVDLHTGDDLFVASLTGDVAAGSAVDLDANGYNGQDRLVVRANDFGLGAGSEGTWNLVGENGLDAIAVNVDGDLGGDLTVRAWGQNAQDAIAVKYRGVLTGSLDVAAYGANGTDAITFLLDVGDGSTGSANADLYGGNGHDLFSVLSTGATGTLAQHDVNVVGGAGTDRGKARGSVELFGVALRPPERLGLLQFQFIAGHLLVTGTNGSDLVRVIDDGSTVSVVSGISSRSFVGVTDITVNTWNGNDRLVYDLAMDGPALVERRLEANLGNGVDAFEATLSGAVAEGSVVDLTVAGQNGPDTLTVAATAFGLSLGSTATWNLIGANGNGLIRVDVAGVLAGDLTVVAWGDTGSDDLAVALDAGAGSTGTATVRLAGGTGPDTFELIVGGDTSAMASVDLSVDGGQGPDSGVLSSVATAIDVEDVTWV